MDEAGRSDDENEALPFLIERYAMIDGKYYRDLPQERRDSILEDALKSASSNGQEKSWALREILHEYGAFRGVPFSKQPATALDDFIAAGKPRRDKTLAAEKAALLRREAEAAEFQKECEERTVLQTMREALQRQRQEEAPYRFSSDAVLSVLPSRLLILSRIFEVNKRISPAFAAQELGLSKDEAKQLLNDAADRGECRRTATGWFEKSDG
jgi:hypothetical protein